MPAARGRTRKHKKSHPYPGPRQCHPRNSNTCFPDKLHEWAVALGVSQNGSAAVLRRRLGIAVGLKPDDGERTFLEKMPVSASEKTALAREMLRPSMPSSWNDDPDMWLDSNNIADVMKQYEEARSDFEFMGPFPIDFAAPDPYGGGKKCLISEICNFRVQSSLAAGKKYIGIVYNLDPHFKSGSHWVANYIDIPRKMCYYFDSYGMEPPHQIAKFMRWITTHDPEIQLRSNGRRFQFKNTECGMYCLYFLIRMLSGDDFKTLIRRDPSDAFMLSLRKWLFST